MFHPTREPLGRRKPTRCPGTRSRITRHARFLLPPAWLFLGFAALAAEIDLTQYDPACGVTLRPEGDHLKANWGAADGTQCGAEFSLQPGTPLLRSLEIAGKPLAAQVQPVFLITTG